MNSTANVNRKTVDSRDLYIRYISVHCMVNGQTKHDYSQTLLTFQAGL